MLARRFCSSIEDHRDPTLALDDAEQVLDIGADAGPHLLNALGASVVEDLFFLATQQRTGRVQVADVGRGARQRM